MRGLSGARSKRFKVTQRDFPQPPEWLARNASACTGYGAVEIGRPDELR